MHSLDFLLLVICGGVIGLAVVKGIIVSIAPRQHNDPAFEAFDQRDPNPKIRL